MEGECQIAGRIFQAVKRHPYPEKAEDYNLVDIYQKLSSERRIAFTEACANIITDYDRKKDNHPNFYSAWKFRAFLHQIGELAHFLEELRDVTYQGIPDLEDAIEAIDILPNPKGWGFPSDNLA